MFKGPKYKNNSLHIIAAQRTPSKAKLNSKESRAAKKVTARDNRKDAIRRVSTLKVRLHTQKTEQLICTHQCEQKPQNLVPKSCSRGLKLGVMDNIQPQQRRQGLLEIKSILLILYSRNTNFTKETSHIHLHHDVAWPHWYTFLQTLQTINKRGYDRDNTGLSEST